MAGDIVRAHALLLQHVISGHRNSENGGLRILRELQCLIGSGEAKLGNRESQRPISFLKDSAGHRKRIREFPAHAGILGSLTRKKKYNSAHLDSEGSFRLADYAPTAIGKEESSRSIRSFSCACVSSDATRTAFFMALALDLPWPTMATPRTP